MKRDLCVTQFENHWPSLPVPACTSPLYEYSACLMEWVECPPIVQRSHTGYDTDKLVALRSFRELEWFTMDKVKALGGRRTQTFYSPMEMKCFIPHEDQI